MGVILEILPSTSGTINTVVWKLGTSLPHTLLSTVMMAAFYLTSICTLSKEKDVNYLSFLKHASSIQKDSCGNFVSPVRKTLDGSVDMLSLWVVVF